MMTALRMGGLYPPPTLPKYAMDSDNYFDFPAYFWTIQGSSGIWGGGEGVI
jgi:hypothetical protein